MTSRSLALALALALVSLAPRAHANEHAPMQSPPKGERILTDEQRAAAVKELRACWVAPKAMPADAVLTLLIVVSDDNKVLDATIVPEDQDRADTPMMRPFALSALKAVTDQRCARLDIPNGSIGRDWLFRLRFTG